MCELVNSENTALCTDKREQLAYANKVTYTLNVLNVCGGMKQWINTC